MHKKTQRPVGKRSLGRPRSVGRRYSIEPSGSGMKAGSRLIAFRIATVGEFL
jgi:hypothetical protein